MGSKPLLFCEATNQDQEGRRDGFTGAATARGAEATPSSNIARRRKPMNNKPIVPGIILNLALNN
ncbi:MAG: hypothetical protein JST65_17665 [Acidobacteria bacterium]|nr:hypothetical protein [Acidobacteriota bacterium]